MNNIEYWEKRAEDKLKSQYKNGEDLNNELKDQYEKALAEIRKNIADFYMRFAKDNNMTYVDAVKQLTGKEYDRWRKSIDEYIEELKVLGDLGDSEFKELLLELNTLAMKSRINRLEGLMLNIQIELAKLYEKEHTQITGLLKDVAEDVYYQTIYDVQVGRGIGHSFDKLDSQTIGDIISYPWSGDNYSNRIWKQKDKLVDTIKQELTQKFIQGKDVKTTAKAVSDKMNVSYKNACTLVETETSYIAGQTTLKGYKATEIEQYQYLATLDTRTSELCRHEDGKVFNIDDAVVGVNYPPLHVRCRSTTIPYFQDEKGERAARGADGKTYYVPGDMTYKDWYDKYVKGNPEEELTEKKVNNLSSDKKQYKEYKSVLGKDAPKSFDKFQELKYNNSEEWGLLKDYMKSRSTNMISAFNSFGDYKKYKSMISNQLVGLTTSNGILIRGQSKHFIERVFGTTEDPHIGGPRTGVEIDDIKNALLNGSVRVRKSDPNSIKFVTDKCMVSINPNTGNLIQVNPQ